MAKNSLRKRRTKVRSLRRARTRRSKWFSRRSNTRTSAAGRRALRPCPTASTSQSSKGGKNMNKQEQAASVAVIGSTSEAYARKEEVERCIFSADFMRFIMAQPSPDYWTPRPVPLVGACRYCGQTRPTAEAPAGSIKTQEDADEWASRTCNCEQGRRLANVWTASGRINALFADFSTDVREKLVAAVQASGKFYRRRRTRKRY